MYEHYKARFSDELPDHEATADLVAALRSTQAGRRRVRVAADGDSGCRARQGCARARGDDVRHDARVDRVHEDDGPGVPALKIRPRARDGEHADVGQRFEGLLEVGRGRVVLDRLGQRTVEGERERAPDDVAVLARAYLDVGACA